MTARKTYSVARTEGDAMKSILVVALAVAATSVYAGIASWDEGSGGYMRVTWWLSALGLWCAVLFTGPHQFSEAAMRIFWAIGGILILGALFGCSAPSTR